VGQLTSLPVVVVNTHGHFDHIRSNYQFGSACISDREDATLKMHNDPQWVKRYYRKALPGWAYFLLLPYISKANVFRPWHALPLPEEGYFELGDRRVSFFDTPGHTPGSISLLDESQRLLFTGDTTCGRVLLNLPESTDVETFRDTLLKIHSVAEKAGVEQIYVGHGGAAVDRAFLLRFVQNCNNILDGSISDEDRKRGVSKFEGTLLNFKPDGIHKIQRNARLVPQEIR
jgi:hydroxyacylglutathione hydrolase